ncbi:MAG: stage II sporulation protein P [Clostridia bacterium]|nr:stage II sporulation protein P [Clostridia bacterium]MDD4375181.1 stage II sporulation protein P [Clostridia bacterium]
MKITGGFFNVSKKKIRIENIFKISKYIFCVIMLSSLMVCIGDIIFKNEYTKNNLLLMGNNIIRIQNKEKELLVMAMNHTPFIVSENKQHEVKKEIKAEKTKKEKLQKEGFDVSLVDVDSTVVFAKIEKENYSQKETNNAQKTNIYNATILNYSSKKDIDFLSLYKKNITLTKKSDPVLIYSTHTSESYTNSKNYKFDYSSSYRTREAKYNMISVGKILNESLKEKNMTTIFDTTPHDYASYEIAYTNSRKTIKKNMETKGRIGLSIDVHRDALSDLTEGPTVEVNGVKVAKLMFVMGVGTENYKNEYWEGNLALALQLQKLGEEMYPGLFRPMIIRNSKYNQDMIENSFLIEVGSTGNSLEEAYYSARCLANVLNKFYNN